MGELAGQQLDAALEDVGEPEQQRQPHALLVQVHREVVEVEPVVGLRVRVDRDVPLRVDAEVPEAPALLVVQPGRILGSPLPVGDRVLPVGDGV